MDSEELLFSRQVAAAPRWMIFFKRTVILVVVLHLLIGIVSSYRAYFQVHRLVKDLADPDGSERDTRNSELETRFAKLETCIAKLGTIG